MSISRYYFPDIIGDDSLSVLAVAAKGALQQNENVVKIFQTNNEFLYGQSPKQLLFLMKQNNKSVCSFSPSPENSPTDAKSYQGNSTPVKRNTYTCNIPRRHLQLDDAENKVSQSGSIVLGTPVRREMVIAGSKDENVLYPLGEKASMVEEQFSSPIGSPERSRRSHLQHNDAEYKASQSGSIVLGTPVKREMVIAGSKDENVLNPLGEKASMVEEQISGPIGATEKSRRSHLHLDDAEYKVSQSESIMLGTPVRREMVIAGSKDENVINPLGEKASMVKEQISSHIGAPGGSRRRKIRTPVKHQTVIVGSTDETILIPTIEKAAMTEQQFSSPIGSTGKPKADNEKSPCSAEMVKGTENLTRAEKEMRSPVEVTNKVDSSCHKSPPSAEVTLMKETASLTMNEDKLESPTKVARNIKPGNQESPRAAEITRMTSGLTVDNKESRGIVRDNQFGGNSNTNTDSLDPEANTENFDPDTTNKDSIKSDEETARTTKLSMEGSETPSPVKRYRMSNISTYDIHMFDSSTQNVGKTDNSLEVRRTPISPDIPDIKISPNEASKEITRDDMKRKSLSPKKRITKLLSIPRVIKSDEKIEIEVSGDLNYNVSPSTSRISSIDYRSRSTKENKSPVLGESKTDTSPRLFEQFLIPPSKPISGSSSYNISGTNSPASDDDVFVVKHPSDIPSTVTMTTRDRSCKSESSLTSVDPDTFLLKRTILKFNKLLSLRDAIMKNNYCSLLIFQSALQFLMSYFNSVEHIVLAIGILDREYLTKEFKETVNNASTLASKLAYKLKSWKREVDFDVETWINSLKQIHDIKEQYEPLLSNEGRPVVSFEIVQVYEYEMKAIWKKLDDMIMTDSRRTSFSHIDHDVEKLMKMFIKCLIHVGILQPR